MITNKGIVLVGKANENNDAVILSLTCNKDSTARSGIFIDLGYKLLNIFLAEFPNNLLSALSTDFTMSRERYTDPKIWEKCDIVDDAIKVASKLTDDNIELKDYKSLRVIIGRGLQQIYTYSHPDMKIASAVIMTGSGLNNELSYVKSSKICENIAKRIALTNPLCIYSHIITPSILNSIRLNSIDEALEQNMEEAADDIATHNIKHFIESYVLEEQINENGDKISKIMKDNNIYSNGDFIRIQL